MNKFRIFMINIKYSSPKIIIDSNSKVKNYYQPEKYFLLNFIFFNMHELIVFNFKWEIKLIH